MSLFTNLRKKINNQLDTPNLKEYFKYDWWTKRTWKKMCGMDEKQLNELIEIISREINNEVNNMPLKRETSSKNIFVLRKEIDISKERARAVKKGKYLEEALERVIINNVNAAYNQFNLLSGLLDKGQTRKSIDIVLTNHDREITDIIEVKGWKTAENPLSAVVQIWFNYSIMIKASNRLSEIKHKNVQKISNDIGLFVLAPKGYYNYWKSDESYDLEKKLQENIQKKINFKFQYLNVSIECVKKAIAQMEKDKSVMNSDIKNAFNRRGTIA